MRIAAAISIEDHILFVEAEDGSTGVFDLKPYLGAEVFAPLQDHAEFSAVHNGGYFLEWSCGADLSADTIEANMRAAPADIAEQLNKAHPRTARRLPREAAGCKIGEPGSVLALFRRGRNATMRDPGGGKKCHNARLDPVVQVIRD